MRGLFLDARRCQWQQRGRLSHCKDDPSGALSRGSPAGQGSRTAGRV